MRAIRIPEGEVEKVEEFLRRSGLKERKVKNTLWSYEGEGVYLNMHPSKTLLIQGRDSEAWAERVLSLIDVPEGPLGGCDEAGKGDIFGPLVLCCAVLTPENFRKVLSLNPKDSKLLEDEEVMRKAEALRGLVQFKCITLMPERLNELYERYGNLNRLMDDAYLKILEYMLKEFYPLRVVVDRYSIKNPFIGLERVLFLEKGERDVAVSVASILARGKFLKKLREMEETYGVKIPKGASKEAKAEAQKLLRGNPELARRLVKLGWVNHNT